MPTATERDRQRIRCFADDLKEPDKQRLDDMLADVRYTYQEIAKEMQNRGYEVSKSAIGRYACRSRHAQNRLREMHDRTEQLVRAVKDGADIQSGEIAGTMLLDMIVQRLATAEDEIDKVPINKVALMLSQLQRTAIFKGRYKDNKQRTIDHLQENIMNRMRELVQEDSEMLDKLMTMVATAAQEEAAKEDG